MKRKAEKWITAASQWLADSLHLCYLEIPEKYILFKAINLMIPFKNYESRAITLNKSDVSVVLGVFAFGSSTSKGKLGFVCWDLVMDCRKCSTRGEN